MKKSQTHGHRKISLTLLSMLQLFLDINEKITLICWISCIGCIMGYAPISKSKQNAGISSVEVPYKLYWWHSRQKTCSYAAHRHGV